MRHSEHQCQTYKSHDQQQVTMYRPLLPLSNKTSVFGRFSEWLYSKFTGTEALERKLRDSQAQRHARIVQTANHRVEQENFADYPPRRAFRPGLRNLLISVYSLNGPAFSPPRADIDIEIEWYLVDKGFDVRVYGYVCWNDHLLAQALKNMALCLPSQCESMVKPDQECITFIVRVNEPSLAVVLSE